jgi:3-oxoacyl-[acyl-carrier-protein] synthase-3
MYSRITGTGSYLPEKILTNLDLERMVDTSDEWIRTRTGITQRHIAGENQVASDLALYACQNAMQAAGVTSQDIDLIIVATTTPDMIFPSTACILQNKLGIENCPAFDVQAVCSGFVYALATADMFVSSGKCRNALVVGSEIYSKILDWNDRSTCVLFGDGAGPWYFRKAINPAYYRRICMPAAVIAIFFPHREASAAAKYRARLTSIWKAMLFLNSPSRFWKKSCRKQWQKTICNPPISTG